MPGRREASICVTLRSRPASDCNYLKALEEEDFARLPGEVFVKGFLKNYGKFLRLDEFEVMKRYGESRSQNLIEHPDTVEDKAPAPAVSEQKTSKLTSIEPFLWGAGIVIALILFVFTALPERHKQEKQKAVSPISTGQTGHGLPPCSRKRTSFTLR